jgi:hypothetical protein
MGDSGPPFVAGLEVPLADSRDGVDGPIPKIGLIRGLFLRKGSSSAAS